MTDRRATFEEVKSSMIPNPDHESKTKGLRCAERNIEGGRDLSIYVERPENLGITRRFPLLSVTVYSKCEILGCQSKLRFRM